MKISLCITVLNEEGTIEELLNSVLKGSRLPDEIVIVDGGSTDSTQSVITNLQFKIYKKNPKIGFKFVELKNASIAKGRNTAIKNATGNIIVLTDAGCIVKKDWLKKIVKPFEANSRAISQGANTIPPPRWKVGELDIVAGFYEMPAKSSLQAVMNCFHGIPPQRFDPKTFIPSARSVAFFKAVWKKLGGFDETLKGAGEDSLFFYNAVKNNFKIDRVGEAQVIWEERRNLSLGSFVKKTYNYAVGDSEGGVYWHPSKGLMSHNIKILFIFVRYITVVVLTFFGFTYPPLLPPLYILISLYLFYPILKWSDVIKGIKGWLWLPVVQILSDMAVMAGFTKGILNKYRL